MPNSFNSYDDLIDPNYQKMSLIQALLAAAAKINPGPTTMPQSLGSALPAAMGAGMQSYMGSQQAGLQQAGLAEKLREMKDKRAFDKEISGMDFTKPDASKPIIPNAESYGGMDVPLPSGFETTQMTPREKMEKVIGASMNRPGGLERAGQYASLYKALEEPVTYAGPGTTPMKGGRQIGATTPFKSEGAVSDYGKWLQDMKLTDSPETREQFIKMKRSEAKPVNMQPWYDNLVKEKLGANSNNPEYLKKFDDWLTTDEGKKEASDARKKYASEGAYPLNLIVPGYQTPSGQPTTYNARGTPGAISGDLQKTPSEADIKEARTKTTMDAVIDEFEKSFGMTNDGVTTIIDPKNPINNALPATAGGRVAGYPGRAISTFTQSDPSLTLADKLSKGFLAKFARAAGEVGTLTDQDIGRAKQLVPSINDVPEVRAGKMTKIRALATEIYERGKRQPDPLRKQQQGQQPSEPSSENYTVGGLYQGKKIKGINKATRQLNVEGLGVVPY